MEPFRPLIVLIVVLAASLYLGGVVWAGVLTLKGGGNVPEPMLRAVTAIGAILATHFGALFGISQTAGEEGPSIFAIGSWAQGLPVGSAGPPPYSGLQVAAAYFYFVSLLLACAIWAYARFAPKADEVIKSMTYTFIGVLAGMLAIILNAKQ